MTKKNKKDKDENVLAEKKLDIVYRIYGDSDGKPTRNEIRFNHSGLLFPVEVLGLIEVVRNELKSKLNMLNAENIINKIKENAGEEQISFGDNDKGTKEKTDKYIG